MSSWLRRLGSAGIRRSAQRGSATVEFALLAMVMITVMFGATEYGRVTYQYNTLVKAVRSAARYASNNVESTTVKDAAKNLVVYGSTTAGTSGSELVPGLTVGKVVVTYAVLDASTSTVTVKVSGLQFQPAVSWLVPAFTLKDITAVMTQAR